MTRWLPMSVTLMVVLVLFSAWHLGFGAVKISPPDLWRTLMHQQPEYEFILYGYRMPRLVIAALVGAALALSGLLVQGVVRNPLASPDILGVTGGASLAVVGFSIAWTGAPVAWVPIVALAGGFASLGCLLWLARPVLNQPASLALVGVALSALFAAAIDFLLTLYPLEINSSLIWLTGSVWGRNWSHLPLIVPWLIILIPVAALLAYRLDLLNLGDATATSLGTRVSGLRLLALLTAVALASASVSVCGAISFVGLVAPHMARFLVGHRHLPLIPVCLLLGAILMVSADLFARVLMPPIELPAGIVTAFIGAPYFVFLITRYKHW
ncbi:FecCD family ABC transporter permease [Saccharospirillum impatiens]|uniref:FecCD family ABC transporter permease n=1 Tax=Saccharospirillum impatiens TaxID=169438 RepID=UPI00040EC772|nr:iron chelate uptake ABC transporter family permease subunit [Saccharospirillum impatiens]